MIRRFSTAQLLALLTTGIVFLASLAGIVATALALNSSAIDGVRERLKGSVRQVASVAATGIRTAQPRYAAVARDSMLHRVLRQSENLNAAESKAIRAALARLSTPTDSGMPIELWSARGRKIGFVGNDVRDSLALAVGGESDSPAPEIRPGLRALRPVDTLQVGQLYALDGRAFFWIAMPVLEQGRLLGFILQQRRIAANAQTERTIRELSGDSTTGYYHNADGSTWTTFGGFASAPPKTDTGDSSVRRRTETGDVLFADAAVDGTPLVVSMETPTRAVLARSHAVVRRLSWLGLGLTVLAGALAWFVGLAIARPLERISVAADDVARGDYSPRVPVTGTHDIARLSSRFNNMASQIGESRVELARREEELRVAAAAAHAANQAKSDFLAAMSHELRTPLNAIGGYAELLEIGIRGPVTEEQRRDLNRIQQAQQHLLGLIGGVLDFARLESGRITYAKRDVEVQALFTWIEPLIAPQAAANQQTLTFESPDPRLTIVADDEKVRQILLNLLSNAVRHTPAGATIVVSSRRAAKRVAIVVSDNGPGIPADRREAVFEPFVQLDRTLTTSTKGIGLGLAISRDLARAMGGDLYVSDAPSGGAAFTLELPAA